MLTLHKAIHRKTAGVYKTLYASPRPIVVSLMPGDVIEFREAGRRGRFPLEISRAFLYAIRLKADAMRTQKIAARKARKKARFK